MPQVDTGGGVWRAKWHPRDAELLLAACMYDGFAVLRAAAGEAGGLEILETYEHASGSLSYGADWCRGEAASGGGSATWQYIRPCCSPAMKGSRPVSNWNPRTPNE